MRKSSLLIALFIYVFNLSFGQQLNGSFSALPEKKIVLKGFNGFQDYAIDSAITDKSGRFSLSFTANDYGMGFLVSEDNTPYIVVLASETISLRGVTPSAVESIQFKEGKQNQAFLQYAKEQPRREQAINAWRYLQKMYRLDSLFAVQKTPNASIQNELLRLNEEEQQFLAQLPKESYVRWFLPIRKLVSSVSAVAQYRTEEIPATLNALRTLDYGDSRLYKSGLYKEVIENHVWFIENSSGALDKVHSDLNKSIDLILEKVVSDPKKYNEVTDYLFNLLEKRSLFTSSEYLALKVLNEQSCTLETDVAKQLEGYRKMKIGSKVPDILFGVSSYNTNKVTSLHAIKSRYTVVVFAAAWCGHCQTELPELVEIYKHWNSKGVEVVLVSLDETQTAFESFASSFPFISTTDLKKWEGKAVSDYYVFGTPTIFLLDEDKKIVLRPNSMEHLNAWLNYNLLTK